MASNIVPGNIDGTYPKAGQDNSSQGFRDNFTETKNNFTTAASEITALQTNKASLNASNDFANNESISIDYSPSIGVKENMDAKKVFYQKIIFNG